MTERALPGGALPGGALPGGVPPDGAQPGGAAPDEAVPDEAVPDEAVPEGAVPAAALADDAPTGAAVIRRLVASPDAATDDQLVEWYSMADRRVPWLRANFVSSIDGAATHNGLSAGLGSAADQRVFHLLRRLADVIVVGAGTVRAEGYGGMLLDSAASDWRERNGLAAHPVLAIVSARLDLDPGSSVFTDAPTRPIVLTSAAASDERRSAIAEVADTVDCGDDWVDTMVMRERLVERGLTQMHSEGGPHLLGAMIEDGALDEICLTVASRLEGGTARRIADGHLAVGTGMTLAHALVAADGTLMLRYVRG
jgi:riboflavin biosynthesis pyrimidine reductase